MVASQQEPGGAGELFIPVVSLGRFAAGEGTADRNVESGEIVWIVRGELLHDSQRPLVPVYSQPRSDARLFHLPNDDRLQRLPRGDGGGYNAMVHVASSGDPGVRQSWHDAGDGTLEPRDGHPKDGPCPLCAGLDRTSRLESPPAAERRLPRAAAPTQAPRARRARA